MLHLTSTALASKNKKGILTPNKDGYYRVPVGGLNVANRNGQYYIANGARDAFNRASTLRRRLDEGNLRGELGHPTPRVGESTEEYISRASYVDEKNTCVHFKDIWLDEDFGKNNPHLNNPKLVGIIAELTPSGIYGDVLDKSIKNPNENTAFSIRCITDIYYEQGVTFKVIKSIITFDSVNDPGIMIADKWNSPALESTQKFSHKPIYDPKNVSVDDQDTAIDSKLIKKLKESNRHQINTENVSPYIKEMIYLYENPNRIKITNAIEDLPIYSLWK